MLRILLEYLLPLLLPFLAYVGYVALTRGATPGWLDDAPWPLLAVIGLVLTAASLLTWNLLTGAPPEAVYVPPHLQDGKVVPGTTVAP